MDTCFLFTEQLTETGCLCLKLAANGAIIKPPIQSNYNMKATLSLWNLLLMQPLFI
jgi:hypothetical protein